MARRLVAPAIDRRSFLIGTLAAGLSASQAFAHRAPVGSSNGKLRVAAVGCGGMGARDLAAIAEHPMVEIAALCDVDRKILATAARAHPGAKTFVDYREIFAGHLGWFDAVTCAAPDHHHGVVGLMALRARKHLYSQKPLARTFLEARRLREEAARQSVVTQMGIQLQATRARRLVAEMLRVRAAGRIKAVHLWTNRPAGMWAQGGPRPAGEDEVPSHLDWDSWLGPAPARPYKAGAYAPVKWRGTLDFGTGALGDMGCHLFDAPFEGLGLGPPLRVTAESEGLTDDQWPRQETVVYEFAGTDRTAGPTLPLTWYDGGRRPPDRVSPHLPAPLPAGIFDQDGAALFVGEEGTIALPLRGMPILFPEAAKRGFVDPGSTESNHWTSWVDACLGKGRTAANFDFAGRVSEAVLIGTVAGRMPGAIIEWDDTAGDFKENDAASALLLPTYRDRRGIAL